MPAQPATARRYLRALALALLALLGSVALFCGLVDPYGIIGTPTVAHLTARKLAAADRPRLSKPYRVEHMHPSTVLLGSSTTNIGFDPDSPAWPQARRPVFNMGIDGSSLDGEAHFLRHTLALAEPGLVVMCVAFEDSMVSPRGRLTAATAAMYAFEPRMRVGADGSPNPGYQLGRAQDWVFALLSLPALTDSVRTLLGQERSTVDVQTAAGFDEGARFMRWTASDGAAALFGQKDIEKARDILRWQREKRVEIDGVRTAILAARAAGAKVVVAITPAHADQMEVRRQLGLAAPMQAWRRDLARLVADAAAETGGDAYTTLWDFDGYSPYTTESLPPPGDTSHALRWFFETVHFRPALGTLMIQRMLGGDIPADLGAMLTPATVDESGARNDAAQRAWVAAHPTDVARIAGIVAAARQAECQTNPASCGTPVAAAR